MLPQNLRLVPCNNEKRPLISNWVERASSDPRQHRAWESEFPNCLWGIITGELFDVIDVDPKGIPWALEHERDLRTYTQTTRRRGRHYYFLPTPGLKNSTSKVAPGVDVKTIGGLVIFWRQQGYPVIDRPMVPMPAWIVELAGKKTTSPPLAVAIGPVGDPSDREMKYAAASLDNACLELRSCAAGGRNQLLNTLAFSMGRMIARGWLARELVEHT